MKFKFKLGIRYRIVYDDYAGYAVQIKERWWWPKWRTPTVRVYTKSETKYTLNTWPSREAARDYAELLKDSLDNSERTKPGKVVEELFND